MSAYFDQHWPLSRERETNYYLNRTWKNVAREIMIHEESEREREARVKWQEECMYDILSLRGWKATKSDSRQQRQREGNRKWVALFVVTFSHGSVVFALHLKEDRELREGIEQMTEMKETERERERTLTSSLYASLIDLLTGKCIFFSLSVSLHFSSLLYVVTGSECFDLTSSGNRLKFLSNLLSLSLSVHFLCLCVSLVRCVSDRSLSFPFNSHPWLTLCRQVHWHTHTLERERETLTMCSILI